MRMRIKTMKCSQCGQMVEDYISVGLLHFCDTECREQFYAISLQCNEIMKGKRMEKREVVKYVVTEVESEDPSKSFNGGAYSYGRSEFRDYWTGELLAVKMWTSAEFQYCPLNGGFNCSCPDEEHEQLWSLIDQLHIVSTIFYYEGDLESKEFACYGIGNYLNFVAKV
jgi:hypothetical protein